MTFLELFAYFIGWGIAGALIVRLSEGSKSTWVTAIWAFWMLGYWPLVLLLNGGSGGFDDPTMFYRPDR